MPNLFDFLKNAKPASLYKLVQQLQLGDAAIVLAGLPAGLSVQVLAYFSEAGQNRLVPAMREARQADRARAMQAVEAIKRILAETKKAAGTAPEADGGQAVPGPGTAVPAKPLAPASRPQPPARAGARPPPGRDKPLPWVPKTATASPINGPAIPGKPPVEGDPMRSPLVRSGFMDLLGRARETLLPKAGTPRKPAPPGRPRSGGAAGPDRPPAVEGVIGSKAVTLNPKPRVLGVGAEKAAPGAGARRMDGKAILAAILREADGGVRKNVESDDPGLFRELRNRMFAFDDLNVTGDAALAQVFTVAPAAEAALALRFAAPALRRRVLRVVSPGRAEALRDVRPGRIGLDAIEQAQKAVLGVALQLQAAGRILIDPRDPDLAG